MVFEIEPKQLKKMKNLVKKYLLGQMTPEEKASFEQTLQTNLELQELLEFYKKMPNMASLQQNLDESFEKVLSQHQVPKIDLKEINDYHKDKMSLPQRRAFEKKLQKNPQLWEQVMAKNTQKSTKKRIFGLVAACVCLLAVGVSWWYYPKDDVAHLDNLSEVDMSQKPILVFQELFTKASTDGSLVDTLQNQLIAVLQNPTQEYEVLENSKRIKKITPKEYVSVFKTENHNFKVACGIDTEDVSKNKYVFMLVKPNENYKRIGTIYASLQKNKIVLDSIFIEQNIQIRPILKIVQ